MALCSLVTLNPVLMANLVCSIALSIQLGGVLHGYFYPTQTTINVYQRNLKGHEFPLIFKICISPGFNISAIKEAGYPVTSDSDPFFYFSGQSLYNSSDYGWAGHTNGSGVMATVEEIAKKVMLHTVEDVILRIITDDRDVSLDTVKVWRMNYPDNCFTLDLTNNTKIREIGIKEMFFQFPNQQKHSVDIYMQGKSLACNREIKNHKFYSSGANIKESNLGSSIFMLKG